MSTSPSTLHAVREPVVSAVFAQLPDVRRPHQGVGGAGASSTPGATGAATTAAGWAAGWAQGVAAAAAREAVAVATAAEGFAAEREALREAVHTALAALERAAQQLHERTAPAVADAADAVAAGAVDLAEVLIGHELDSADARSRATAALGRALAAAPEHEDVVVRLHPGDLAALESVEESLTDLTGRTQLTLAADPRLTSGDAVAEFPGGSVDARIDTALSRMRSVLRGGGTRRTLEMFDVDDL